MNKPLNYDRLRKMGEEKFQKVTNELSLGKSCKEVARMIQQDWKECLDVTERSFVIQINRYRLHLMKGRAGSNVMMDVLNNSRVEMALVDGTSIDTIKTLSSLIRLQNIRIMQLWNEEQRQWAEAREPKKQTDKVKSINPISSLSGMINDQADLLERLQKMRFDLGMDVYAAPTLAVRGSDTRLSGSGYEVHQQVFEAVRETKELFKRAGVYMNQEEVSEALAEVEDTTQ
jgi:hypothetical protein